MILHFLVNDSTIAAYTDCIDQNRIIEMAKNVFLTDVDDFKIYHCSRLVLGKIMLDYNCVVDGKVEVNPIEKKKKFTDDLQAYMKGILGREAAGVIRLQTGFQMQSVSSSNTKKPEETAEKPEGNASEVSGNNESAEEFDYEKRAAMYQPVEPSYTFDRVILPQKVRDKIEESLAIVECEQKVFKEWGLSVIQPNPSSALSFYGPSGTGKTMAAEAIAHKLHKKILKVSYADIESKYHGEGPKMVKAIFVAAEREDAVLFIDESDSLLSKRLTNVTQGSEQAINSMRSQLLICLENFKGIVIFATNLVVNYDQAFLTRLISIEFVKPDKTCREQIWNVHIKGNGINIPLADDVNTSTLAEQYEFCGRDIRKAVISACVSVAMHDGNIVTQADFLKSCEKIKDEEERLANAEDHTKSNGKALTPTQQDILKTAIKSKLASEKEQSMDQLESTETAESDEP